MSMVKTIDMGGGPEEKSRRTFVRWGGDVEMGEIKIEITIKNGV